MEQQLLSTDHRRCARALFTGIVRTDDITFEQHSLTGCFFLPKFLQQTFLGIERDDTNDEKIHRRGQDGQTEKDERHAEEEVLSMMHEVFITMMLLLMKRTKKSRSKQFVQGKTYEDNVIAEADRCQRDEPVVERIEERPFLVLGEDTRANQENDDGQERLGDQQFSIGDFRLLHVQRMLEASENVAENGIQSFARRLKGD